MRESLYQISMMIILDMSLSQRFHTGLLTARYKFCSLIKHREEIVHYNVHFMANMILH